MTTRKLFLLLLALAGLGAAAGAATPSPLTLSDALLKFSSGQTLVTAPGWALQGTLKGASPAGASSPQDCATVCSGTPGCLWANFCSLEVRMPRDVASYSALMAWSQQHPTCFNLHSGLQYLVLRRLPAGGMH